MEENYLQYLQFSHSLILRTFKGDGVKNDKTVTTSKNKRISTGCPKLGVSILTTHSTTKNKVKEDEDLMAAFLNIFETHKNF